MGLSADDYRAEVAKAIYTAAATGLIPQRITLSSRRPPIDLSQPPQCCWLVDSLVRSSVGRRWCYMDALPGYPGLQPQLGQCIAALRELMAAEQRTWVAERQLADLRQRVAGIQAAREVLDAMWVAPIRAVHSAGHGDMAGPAEIDRHER